MIRPVARLGVLKRPGVLSARGMWVLVTVVLTISATGYFVGLRESRKTSADARLLPGLSVKKEEDTDGSTLPAAKYSELSRIKLGPNRDWSVPLDKLVQPESAPPPKAPPDAVQRDNARTSRNERRAFEGAPPLIPHPTLQQGVASCLACHEKGMVVGKKIAAKMSHPAYLNCTQCHVEAGPESLTDFAMSKSGSDRAFDSAPPALPHPVWMRENCLSCHGPKGLAGLRTTHPERTSCLQCHAPVAPQDAPPWVASVSKEKP